MALIADILLIAGALGAAMYCLVVARKVTRLASLEGGMGNAIAILSAEVDDMTRALAAAQGAARGSTAQLADLSVRAEETARRLELLLAAMHDVETGSRPGTAAASRTGPVDDAPSVAMAPGPQDADKDETAEPPGLFLTRRMRAERVAS
ncbi:MAG: hypothetical protein MUF73_01705 [Rhodobacteraceae bacterium]|jgi:hypothetical protein|nr:hypothetical protein [Paracoccaceae bacterium]